MKTRILMLLTASLFSVALTGCGDRTENTRFEMPAGDAEKGKAAFVALECYTCHRVNGVDLPAPTKEPVKVVTLGGDVTRMRSYGDLITSIVHPKNAISDLMLLPPKEGALKTPMPGVNETMTVQQLIDLVTFLKPMYKKLEPLYQPNPLYGP